MIGEQAAGEALGVDVSKIHYRDFGVGEDAASRLYFSFSTAASFARWFGIREEDLSAPPSPVAVAAAVAGGAEAATDENLGASSASASDENGTVG